VGSAQAWRVGVLFSQTGVTSVIEKTQLQGTLLAIDEINARGGVLGRPIETVEYDPESCPDKFQTLAKRLVDSDGVNVIFGCYMSSTRKAVLPVVEAGNALLFYPTLYEGFEFSPNVIYTGAAPNQNSVQLAHYLMEKFGPKFYLVGSDYIYPYESNRIMSDLVHQMGGEIINECYVPLSAGEADFSKIIDDVKKSQPNVIFSTVVGEATKHLYKAYAQAGLSPKQMPIASLTTSEAEVREMGKDLAVGHITAAPYFQSIKSEANARFVKLYQKKYGAEEPVTFGAEAAYFQMHIFAEALEQSGSIETAAVREKLLNAEFDAPQGRVRIDADNNHTYLWPRIGRVNRQGMFDIVSESISIVKPDPYLVSPNAHEWGMKKFKMRGSAGGQHGTTG